MNSFRDIIDAWPSRSAFGADIDASPQAVTNMAARNSIPAPYWQALVTAADRRSIAGIDYKLLASLAAAKEGAAA